VSNEAAILHLNLHREFFAQIAAGTARTEYRSHTPRAPEMLVEFPGLRRYGKGRNACVINCSLLFSVQPGFFECSLGVGFLFISIQLRLGSDLVGFDLRFFNGRIHVRLFFGVYRGDVHSFLLIVDGVFGRFIIVVYGRLLFVAAHEDEGGDYYRYQMFHNLQFWLFGICCQRISGAWS